MLWENLGRELPPSRVGDEPRQVFDALSEIALVDVALPKRVGIQPRRVADPVESHHNSGAARRQDQSRRYRRLRQRHLARFLNSRRCGDHLANIEGYAVSIIVVLESR